MMGVREEEATEGVAFAFLTFFFSCFFGCSSSSDSSAFSSSTSSTTSLRFFPFPEVVFEEEVEMGVESGPGHSRDMWPGFLHRKHAPFFLSSSQIWGVSLGRFWVRTVVDFFLSTSMGTPCDKDCLG